MTTAGQLTLPFLEEMDTTSSGASNGHHRFLAGFNGEEPQQTQVIACHQCGKRLNKVGQPCGCQGYGRGKMMSEQEANEIADKSSY